MRRPTVSLRVRRARPADARAIASVQVRSWQAAYPGIVPDGFLRSLSVEDRVARWESIFRESASTVFVAEDDDGLVGWISVGPSRDADAPPTTGELWAIYLAPERWREGAGRTLWAHGRAHLVSAGFADVVVWVFEDNQRARRFYERMGFTATPEGTRLMELGGAALREVRLRAPLGSRH
jgi:ribosomal protein S18 acetylase RimI-like enzyme